MAQPVTTALTLLERMIADSANGINAELEHIVTESGVEVPLLTSQGITRANIASDTAERSRPTTYPSLHVYCERAVNDLKEKFRAFSGTVDFVIELRVTHDHAEEAPNITDAYIRAITSILRRARGRWTESLFYPGAYEIVYGPVKRGGANYLQATKVRLQVMANI